MKDVYTDGSCLGNPGPGGWAAISDTFRVCGGETESTNNRMEMQAVIQGLKKCLAMGHLEVTIYTDSNYVKQGITAWSKKWELNGWRTSTGSAVKNVELWKKLIKISKKFLVLKWEWVKAHNGDPMNEAVDTLARKTAELIKNDDA